jgi:hypothetical protein
MIWYVLPDVDNSISWEGHLAGLISGVIFAILLKSPEYKKVPKYEWEHPEYDVAEDKFMQRFDENGNFVNLPLVEEEVVTYSYFTGDIRVNYSYVERSSANESESN